MPRQSRERISGLPQQQVVSQPQIGNVVASPVDTYVAPSASDNTLLQLAGGLSSLNPGLTKYLDSRQAESNAEQTTLGMAERAGQVGKDAVITAEQSPWFQQGYMKMHGVVSGQNAAVDMHARYEAQKNTPGFNVETFLQESLKADLGGMTDKDALAGYMESSLSAQRAIRTDFAKVQLDGVRAQANDMLMSRANGIVSMPLNAEALRGEYDKLLTQGSALNKTKPEVAQMFATALINASSSGNPDILNAAYIKDQNGISLADNKEMGTALISARAHAVSVQKAKMKEAMLTPNMEKSTAYAKALIENPMALGDAVTFVKNNFGPTSWISTEAEAASKVHEILIAQKKFKDEAAIQGIINGPLARTVLNEPEAKKLHGKADDALWNKLDPTNVESIRQTVNLAVQYHERTGYASDRLKALMQHIDTSGIPDDKGAPPADFMLAVNAYQFLRESQNPQLAHALTNDDTRAVMGEFIDQTRIGASTRDAFLAAKKISTPEARERVKFVMDQRMEMELKDKAKNLFSSFLPNAIGGETARNPEGLQQEFTNVFRSYIAKGVSKDAAMKRTEEDMKARFVWDGHDNFVEIPSSMGEKPRFAKAVAGWMENYKAAEANKNAGPYRLDMLRGGKDYAVMDRFGNPVSRVSAEELLAQQLVRENATPELVQAAQGLSQRIRSKALTQQEAATAHPEARRLFMAGQLSGADYSYVRDLDRQNMRDAAAAGSQLIKDYHSKVKPFLSNSDITTGGAALELGAPIKQPGGTAKSSMEYARDFYKVDPAAALTVAAEGMSLTIHPDNKGRAIGIGYNVDMRKPEQVRKDFVRAGIVESSIDDVLAGKKAITPDQALRLYKVVAPQYEELAKNAIGADAWNVLPAHARAVMGDLAYNTGNPAQFKRVIAALHEGDFKKAADNLTLVYLDQASGKMVSNTRRIALLRAMMAGPDTFNVALNEVDRVSPKR